MIDRTKLHPALQKLATMWPVLGAMLGLMTAGSCATIKAYGQVGENTTQIAETKARVTKLEQRIPDLREDLAIIKQQGVDNGDRLDRIENRLDEQPTSRRQTR